MSNFYLIEVLEFESWIGHDNCLFVCVVVWCAFVHLMKRHTDIKPEPGNIKIVQCLWIRTLGHFVELI